MPTDNQPDSLGRWQGRVDAFLETTPQRIQTLFEAQDVLGKRVELLNDEVQKEMSDLSKQFGGLTARLAVIAAIGSFLGTVVTSLLVAGIIKIFLK